MEPVTEELLAIRDALASAAERVDRLLAARPTDSGLVKDLTGLYRTVAIERVLASSQGPMRPVEIWAELRRAGRSSDPKMEVQVTTYDLWKRGRIGKLGRGAYVALPREGAQPES